MADTGYKSQFMQNFDPEPDEPRSRFVRNMLSGNIPKPKTIDDRVRETYSQTANDRIRAILEKRANDLKYREGADVEILYEGDRTQMVRHVGPGDTTTVKQAKVPTKGTDPEFGAPIGIRVNKTGERSSVPAGDLLIKNDPEWQEQVTQIMGERQNLLQELRESGEVFSFGERVEPGVKATREGFLGNLRSEYGKDNVREIGDEDDHVVILRKGKPPALTDLRGYTPEWADVADVSGDIGESGASIGAQAIAEYAGGRAVKAGRASKLARLAKRSKAGPSGLGILADTAAAIGRQAVSSMFPGEDFPNQSVGESLPERAAHTIMAGAGGALGDTVGKLIFGPLAKRVAVLGKTRMARRLDKEAQEEVMALTSGKKVGQFLQESREAEAVVTELANIERQRAGVPLRNAQMSPAQAVGSEARFIDEVQAARDPKARAKIIQQQKMRQQDSAASIDGLIHVLAKDPDALSDQAVVNAFKDSVNTYTKTLGTRKTALATPLYKKVEELAGNLFSIEPIVAKIVELHGKHGRSPGVAGRFKKAIKFLKKAQDENGNISITDLNQERQQWSIIAGGEDKVGANISSKLNASIGAQMLEAIDISMNHAAKMLPETAGEAVDALRSANKIWTTFSKLESDFLQRPKRGRALGFVEKLLGRIESLDDAGVINELMKHPRRTGNILNLLDSMPATQATAQQTRVKLLLTVFERGQHVRGTAVGEAEERVSKVVDPATLSDALDVRMGYGREKKLLDVLFENDKTTLNRLKAIRRFNDRIGVGLQTPGARSVPAREDARIALEAARRGAIEKITGRALDGAQAMLGRGAEIGGLKLTPLEAATLTIAEGGPDAMYALAEAQANPFRARASAKAARALIHMGSILVREDVTEGLFGDEPGTTEGSVP